MICVLAPQDETASVFSGEGEVEQGHVGGAYVRITRGGGCHPGANLGLCVVCHGVRRMLKSMR